MLEEVAEWQSRPDICYPLVFFDAIRVKVRDEGFVRNKAIYIALGLQPDGTKEILGIWIEQTEGAKFWLRVVKELKTRGVQDISNRHPLRRSRSVQARTRPQCRERSKGQDAEPPQLARCSHSASAIDRDEECVLFVQRDDVAHYSTIPPSSPA